MNLQERIRQAITELSRFSAAEEGVTRLPFTEEAAQAADWLRTYMEDAGLTVWTDPTGAVIGSYEGREGGALLTGSHYDSVVKGGAFDGAAGIVCAVEAVRLLKEQGFEPGYTLDVIATNDEEGVRFSKGFLTSMTMCGGWSETQLEEITDLTTGENLASVMKKAGFEPALVPERKGAAGQYRKFLEVHIEQGPVLDEEELPVGVVTSIAGIGRYFFTITGEANHAGSTPMHARKDALAAAARVILYIQAAAEKADGVVATVGHLEVTPGAINVVPGQVVFSLDMRAEQDADRKALFEQIASYTRQITAEGGMDVDIREVVDAPSVFMEKKLQEELAQAAERLQIPYRKLHSGAGHDAQIYGAMIPVGMLFVRSRGGISHNPAEHTEWADLADAVRVLAEVLKQELTV